MLGHHRQIAIGNKMLTMCAEEARVLDKFTGVFEPRLEDVATGLAQGSRNNGAATVKIG